MINHHFDEEEDPVFGLKYGARTFVGVPKSPDTKRIEVHLLPEIVEKLKAIADKENRSLKNYMETVLINHVKERKKKT